MTALDAAGRVDLESRVQSIRTGDVSVVKVEASDEWNADGELYLRLLVHLSDPQGETWRPEDFDEIGRQVDEVVAGMSGYSEVRILFTGGQPNQDEGPPPDEESDEG